MLLGNQQAVSGKKRPVIQKRQAVLVFKHNSGRTGAACDFTENAGDGHSVYNDAAWLVQGGAANCDRLISVIVYYVMAGF